MEACAAVSILVGGNLHDPLLKRLHGIPGETIKHDSAACFRRIANELLQALLRHRQRCENDELRRALVAGLKLFGGGQHLVEIYRPGWRSPEHSLILAEVAVPAAPIADAWKLTARCRSEEHTSELQSLMRISYADCCMKKKKR